MNTIAISAQSRRPGASHAMTNLTVAVDATTARIRCAAAKQGSSPASSPVSTPSRSGSAG